MPYQQILEDILGRSCNYDIFLRFFVLKNDFYAFISLIFAKNILLYKMYLIYHSKKCKIILYYLIKSFEVKYVAI